MITLENVTKQFGNLTALDDVSLTVEEDKFYSLIGPNGAGKSTLFNVITGLLEPTSGRVLLQDQDITGLSPDQIARRGITRSFQIEDIFTGLTVAENVQVAVQAFDKGRRSVLKDAGTLSAVTDTTDQILCDLELQEEATRRAGDLSYGDRRKVEIGLAIASNPDLLLLDEPTAGMSKNEVQETLELIQRLSDERDFTVVWIEHDLELVMEASDRIVVLHQGELIAEGTPAEVQADDDVQEAYLGEEL